MRLIFVFFLSGVLAAAVAGSACTADIHGNTINANATIPTSVTLTTTADTSHVKAGESIPMHAETDTPASGTAIATEAGAAGTDAAAPAQVADTTFVFQIFVDTVTDHPLLVSAHTDFDVTIPVGTSVGSHKVICRVAHGDGTATNVMSSVDITVTSS